MVLLVKGSDWLVDGSSGLARRYKISEFVIGLTIVGFGTSAPEMIVSVVASADAHPEIALGNVIGSNNFNLLVILGITGLIAPIAVQKSAIRNEIPFSLFAVLVLFLLANFGFTSGDRNLISRVDGMILLLFFAAFLFYVFKTMKREESHEDISGKKEFTLLKSLLFIVFGLICLITGGKVVVNSAVDLAHALHISEKVISLTIVAVGTSLPELATSITAMRKKNSDIAIGNIIGSNIFNIFLILGISALWRPLEYTLTFNIDICLLCFSTLLLLLFMFTGKKRILDRWEAAIFVTIYLGYVGFLMVR